MHTYDTLLDAINDLRTRGYTTDFNLDPKGLRCKDLEAPLNAHEFEITEFHRFEGSSDPDDEAVVYAIDSKHGKKGLLVNGFGVSSDGINDEIIRKLNFHH